MAVAVARALERGEPGGGGGHGWAKARRTWSAILFAVGRKKKGGGLDPHHEPKQLIEKDLLPVAGLPVP
jgi:hypothetical protein